MTELATARIKDVLGLKIGIVQEFAQKLAPNGKMELLENDLDRLESAVRELRQVVESLPHQHH